MKNYIKHDEWKIVEDGFHPEYNRITESLLSIGNGRSGQRANFEEKYSGDTLRGSYIAGIYYPDKTRVGWWKNGYPEYFAKILNATNWIGINVFVNGKEVDLAKEKIVSFTRQIDMRNGLLSRSTIIQLGRNKKIEIQSKRFLSIVRQDIGAIKYSAKTLNFSGKICLEPYIDGDIVNEDSNYDEKFWIEKEKAIKGNEGFVCMETRKTAFAVCTGMSNRFYKNGEAIENKPICSIAEKAVASRSEFNLKEGDEICLEKFASNVSSLYYSKNKLAEVSDYVLTEAANQGFDVLFTEHQNLWEKRWETSDIKIEGDVAAQQGIRFNVFQLNQTYLGDDERLNIGPKGFTGEKYGGVTYWDTEAYCLPFYLGTSNERVAKNLLMYRYKHLKKAIENAEKLGFTNGAALYPMVTINGEECHNEWEITFEEIHRNGAIAYAIYNYINYSGDKEYLAPYGFKVLLGISRFWAQRINWSEHKNKYVMLGVTGPNEYENNVNNNYHTNRLAVWTLKFTLETIEYLKTDFPFLYEELIGTHKFNELSETERWKDIIENMYLPYDDDRQIYLQQDGFLDKEIVSASTINPEESPIHQHWSWDRILRSCFIKQADTLQNFYWFEDDFTKDELSRHFDFYEPITVHESSLSSCVHSILAASLGRRKKAYELYLRTARLDLDDYNNDTEDGLHITSMGGTWLTFVQGFGGMRVKNNRLILNPFIPEKWNKYSFRINFRKAHLEIIMSKTNLTIKNHSDVKLKLDIWDKLLNLNAYQTIEIQNK